jgi:hypothetical protein
MDVRTNGPVEVNHISEECFEMRSHIMRDIYLHSIKKVL